jgi:hypothetical protein
MKINSTLILVVTSLFLTVCNSCTTTRPANDETAPTVTLSILKINSDESSEIISIKNDTCIVIPEDVNYQIIGVGADEQGVKMNNLSISALCPSGTYKTDQVVNGSGGNVGQTVPTSILLNLPLNQSIIDAFKTECSSTAINCYRIKCKVTNFSSMIVYSPILTIVHSKSNCGNCN